MGKAVQKQINIEYVPIEALKPADYNPRKATEKEYSDLKQSLTRFGFVDPIVVNSAENRKNIIIGGHFRLRVAKDLGYLKAPVTYINIPEIEREQELNIRLNKNLGQFDYDLLANFDEDMLKGIGFDSEELDKIFQLDEEKDADDAPAVRETSIKQGDLFELGRHRLLCGDATKIADLERIMDGRKADMVFTDPPYNVDYQGGMNESGKNLREGIKNDNMSDEDFGAFLYEFINAAMKVCEGAFYICMGNSQIHRLRVAFEKAGGHWQNFIIWVKHHFTITRGDYQHQYEPILYGWNKTRKKHYFASVRNHSNVWEDLNNLKTKFDGEYTTIKFHGFEVKIKGKAEGSVKKKQMQTDIWRYDKPTRSEEHPTMKPVKMIEKAIYNSSHRGNIVLDPFGGSGSTLMACQTTNRECRTIELDPGYCQVIIDRWEKYTEQKAKRM